MHDQHFMSVLSTLLDLPEFQEGLQDGQQTFEEGMFEEDHEKAWTEDDIIEFVDGELSKQIYRRVQLVGRVMGWSLPSYLTHLGFTVSYLALILGEQAQKQRQERGEQNATG